MIHIGNQSQIDLRRELESLYVHFQSNDEFMKEQMNNVSQFQSQIQPLC